MIFTIILIVLLIGVLVFILDKNSTHRSNVMYKQLWKKKTNIDSEQIKAGKKSYCFYFKKDAHDIVRGVLYLSNDTIPVDERRIWDNSKDNMSKYFHGLELCGKTFRSIFFAAKGLRYRTYLLGDENGKFQDYIEDARWENSLTQIIQKQKK